MKDFSVNLKKHLGMVLADFANMRKNLHLYLFIASLILSLSGTVQAQEDLYKNTKLALKSANSKELSTYFGPMVKIKINEEESQYSKSQAEFIIRDFMKKYPPTDYQILHQGATKEGNLHYTVGKYSYKDGTFSVYMRIKQTNSNYLIDTIDFSTEE